MAAHFDVRRRSPALVLVVAALLTACGGQQPSTLAATDLTVAAPTSSQRTSIVESATTEVVEDRTSASPSSTPTASTTAPTTTSTTTAPSTTPPTTEVTTTVPPSTDPPPPLPELPEVASDQLGLWTDTLEIMPLGDSITEGPHYRAALVGLLNQRGCAFDMVGTRNRFASVVGDADHQGYVGWKAEELVGIARDAVAATSPDVVIVHAGTNDLAGGRRPANVVGHLDAIIAEIRAGQPAADIIVTMIIPFEGDTGQVAEFNSLVALQVPVWEEIGPGRVVLANVYDGFDVNWHTRDGVHPNAAGGERIAIEYVKSLQVLYGGC